MLGLGEYHDHTGLLLQLLITLRYGAYTMYSPSSISDFELTIVPVQCTHTRIFLTPADRHWRNKITVAGFYKVYICVC